ncbi:DUF354 domain-containing protein [Mongoliibacter ruber]|uniref:DUF354 domain-containing protein n=1 Tax=Mongoliibacter ruber TaxID=1750599 RepID=A0A2T0WW06_9BACT|nr:DUF354 domain-containing protein [Mongoliibacter ruber]PRY90871.1 hypothetical protein CLW00_101546 [Mongoliibacter ruber]
MKIWIDFINTPQVNFFEPLIEDLSQEGHSFILTCRDSSNTVSMLKSKGWDYTIIGEKVYTNLLSKLLGFPRRVLKLRSFLKDKNVDVAIGQSSFYLPITAKSLGIKSIYTNDNEHAMGNIPSFIFADKILLPENLSLEKARKQGARKSKIIQYPGIKEGIYLWKKGLKIIEKRKQNVPDTIYIRPEPNTAQYYTGNSNFLDTLILDLKKDYHIIILVRDKNQFEHYSDKRFLGVEVPKNTISFDKIAEKCLLFIGAGGSMTREMAMIGVPTISVYQGGLLDVDQYLIDNDLMVFDPELTINKVGEFLTTLNTKSSEGSNLLDKGEKAFFLLRNTLFCI